MSSQSLVNLAEGFYDGLQRPNLLLDCIDDAISRAEREGRLEEGTLPTLASDPAAQVIVDAYYGAVADIHQRQGEKLRSTYRTLWGYSLAGVVANFLVFPIIPGYVLESGAAVGGIVLAFLLPCLAKQYQNARAFRSEWQEHRESALDSLQRLEVVRYATTPVKCEN